MTEVRKHEWVTGCKPGCFHSGEIVPGNLNGDSGAVLRIPGL